MNKKELKAKIGDELADIFTEVLFIAHELDIDIEAAFAAMIESDKQKVSKYIQEKK
jgi:NTP pyrophosphatase (non-canonical NTP hydrolase)